MTIEVNPTPELSPINGGGDHSLIFKNSTFDSLTCATAIPGRDRAATPDDYELGIPVLRSERSLLADESSVSTPGDKREQNQIPPIQVICIRGRQKRSRFALFRKKIFGKKRENKNGVAAPHDKKGRKNG